MLCFSVPYLSLTLVVFSLPLHFRKQNVFPPCVGLFQHFNISVLLMFNISCVFYMYILLNAALSNVCRDQKDLLGFQDKW